MDLEKPQKQLGWHRLARIWWCKFAGNILILVLALTFILLTHVLVR